MFKWLNKIKDMKKYIKQFVFIGALLISGLIFGQQAPHFTQFMYNMNVVNPAYAGIKNGLAGGLLYRTQWTGFDGNPQSITFNLHSSVGEKMGLGLSAYNDQFGFVKQNNIKLDYSYKLEVGSNKYLALGLNLGLWNHMVNLTDLAAIHPGDPLLTTDIKDYQLSYGVGLLFYSDHYYVGLSVPNLNTTAFHSNLQKWTKGNVIHYFFTGGYVFDLNNNFKFKPNFMLYQALGAPLAVDLNANLFMYDKVELGVSYRLNDSFSGLINFMITPNIRVGYAYDRTISDMKLFSPNTHEIFLNFILPYKKRAFMSPLYF